MQVHDQNADSMHLYLCACMLNFDKQLHVNVHVQLLHLHTPMQAFCIQLGADTGAITKGARM